MVDFPICRQLAGKKLGIIRFTWYILLAELHGDLFSRHASPLEVYVVAVDERSEHVMSDEICRRCNGKQQGRRRGGRSVQLPDSFTRYASTLFFETFMHVYVRNISTTKYIQRKKK